MSAVSVFSGVALNPGGDKHKATQQQDSNQASGFVYVSFCEKTTPKCKINGLSAAYNYPSSRINTMI